MDVAETSTGRGSAARPTGWSSRKNISKMKGDLTLLDEIRYFFYITTQPPPSGSNARCDQENVIAQHSGVGALRVPVYEW